jgi:adenylate cyclase class IV
VLADSETLQAGIEVAHHVMTQLGIESSQLIESAYVDLLAENMS